MSLRTHPSAERGRILLKATNLAKAEVVKLHHEQYVGIRRRILERLLKDYARTAQKEEPPARRGGGSAVC